MTRTKKRMILCAVLIAGTVAFIWGNSLVSGTGSGAMSGRVMAWINSFLHLNSEDAETLHLVIRKMAHFTEFACLGLLLAWLFCMTGAKKGYLFCMPLFCGILAACADETIQVFVPDRGSSLIDVWIDTAGITAGTAVFLIGQSLIRQKHKRKNKEETT